MNVAGSVRLVVDTNVLLDCWVFDDAAARPLWRAIEAARVRCLRSTDTDAELADVLQRAPFQARLAQRTLTAALLLDRWQALAEAVPRTHAAPWGCTDPHDQKFLDLAVSARAALLVTKDKALLKLARRARRDGLSILAVDAAVAALPPAA